MFWVSEDDCASDIVEVPSAVEVAKVAARFLALSLSLPRPTVAPASVKKSPLVVVSFTRAVPGIR